MTTTPSSTPTPTPTSGAVPEAPKRTAYPTAAGILIIIGAVILIAVGLGAIVGGSIAGWMSWGIGAGAAVAFGSVTLILGIVALIGGIVAIQRRMWGLALAGAIIILFPFFIFGILSIIFVAISKKEFV